MGRPTELALRARFRRDHHRSARGAHRAAAPPGERGDDTRSLRVCIRKLRAKIELDPQRPKYLVTEAGFGYRLHVDMQ